MRATALPHAYPGASVIGPEERAAVDQVLARKSPFRFYGPEAPGETAALEDDLQEYLGRRHVLAVSSGTAALIVAMRALGIGPGDEVIVPAATFVGCVNAVVHCWAVPIFADIDDSVSIDPHSVEQLITARTKAIMVVHWRGMAADVRRLTEIGKRRGIPVIEDCAQGFGATWDGRPVGSWGDVACFSFQMNKVLSPGEGGAVASDDPTFIARAAALHDNGSTRGARGVAEASLFGENYRMSELAAAILRVQLDKLAALRDHVRGVGTIIKQAVAGSRSLRVRTGPGADGDVGVSAILLCASADQFVWARAALKAEGCPIAFPYQGVPCYLKEFVVNHRLWHDGPGPWDPAFYPGPGQSYAPGLCPHAEQLLPRVGEYLLSAAWTESDARDVAAALTKVSAALDSGAWNQRATA